MSQKVSRLYRLVLVAALGGFLFGYDTAIISGTTSMVATQFNLGAVALGWYVSSALVGCIFGVVITGVLTDRFGRRDLLIVSAALFGLSALGCMFAQGYQGLVFYRFLGGIGVGMASMLAPLYISEIAPAPRRGGMVALYQFAITLGILLAYFANASLQGMAGAINVPADTMLHTILVTEVWRVMLGSELLPAVLFFILLIFVPKSPRWLVSKGRNDQAMAVLSTLVPEPDAEREIAEIKEVLATGAVGLRAVFRGGYRLALVIGVCLAFLTQISGINAIIYYGPQILEEAGLKISDALGGQVIIGVVNVLFTLLAIWKIDSLGRRPLLIAGVSGIIVSLACVGLIFYLEIQNTYLLMAFILMFIACFAFSYGPVIWVLLSEIYPTRIRGASMAVATLALWIGTALVGQLTPWLLQTIQPYGTFWLFALVSTPALWLAIYVIPETKGKTLEEIERYWLQGQT